MTYYLFTEIVYQKYVYITLLIRKIYIVIINNIFDKIKNILFCELII